MTSPPAPCPDQVTRLRELMLGTFFRGWSPDYLSSPAFEADLLAHTTRRFEECRDMILPWIERHLPLDSKSVVDIGCGTGASTAAWAQKAERVVGYDIHAPSIDAANGRMEIMGIQNVTCRALRPDALIPAIRDDFPDGADVIIMYAVLEHQKVLERIDTLRASWSLLRPGGLLVVGDSPTRFSMMDFHTSLLPFFNWLPEELAVYYAHKSPRADFRDGVENALRSGLPAAIDYVARCGRGVGYEEFEIAIGDLNRYVVGDSFDDGMINQPHRGVSFVDELIQAFARSFSLKVPRGFLRESLEVILRKPLHPDEAPPDPKPAPVEGLMKRSQVDALVNDQVQARIEEELKRLNQQPAAPASLAATMN
ncbi:MAG: methyltransferase domain-containing protein [Phycisphaeraceae bacterium]|nr:methyltransferase domain-containing protein [Phycisphaeraceae bacterium]